MHLSKIYISGRISCHVLASLIKWLVVKWKKNRIFFQSVCLFDDKKIQIFTCNARNWLNICDVLIFCNICLAKTRRRHCCCKHSFRAHKYQVKLTPNITRSKWLFFSWLLLFSEMMKSKETIRNFMRSITSFIGCVCARIYRWIDYARNTHEWLLFSVKYREEKNNNKIYELQRCKRHKK